MKPTRSGLLFLILGIIFIPNFTAQLLNSSEQHDKESFILNEMDSNILASDQSTNVNPSSTEFNKFLVTRMTYMSVGVLVFGLVLVVCTGIVAFRKQAGWDREATRVFAVAVIVTAGLFLVTAGYSSQQIAPMFGLLGTIVGYLLGKSSTDQSPKPD